MEVIYEIVSLTLLLVLQHILSLSVVWPKSHNEMNYNTIFINRRAKQQTKGTVQWLGGSLQVTMKHSL
jgi:hypothetical protein